MYGWIISTILSLIIIFFSFLGITYLDYHDLHDVHHHILRVFLAVIFTWVFIRLVGYLIYKFSNKKIENLKYQKILHLISIFVLAGFVLYFVISISHIEAVRVVMTGAIITGGLAIVLQDFIKDIFYGIVISFYEPLKIGDWVEIRNIKGEKSDILAKITKVRWLSTELVDSQEMTFYIPNFVMMQSILINNNKIKKGGWFPIGDILIEQNIPVNRVKSIINAAISEAAEYTKLFQYIENFTVAVINNVSIQGISYHIEVPISDPGMLWLAKDQIMEKAIRNLHLNGIQLSQFAGEGAITLHREDLSENKPQITVINALKRTTIFSKLDISEIYKFADDIKNISVKKGESLPIRDEDEKIYIVLEGIFLVFVKNDKEIDKKDNEESEQILVDNYRVNDFFGEDSILNKKNRNVSIVAEIDSEVLEIDKMIVKNIIDEDPKLLDYFAKTLKEREKKVEEILENYQINKSSKNQNSTLKTIEKFFGIGKDNDFI